MIENREKYFFIFLLLLVMVFFQDILFFGKSFWFRDIIRYLFPNRFIAQEMVIQGIFPLWNPYQLCGLPLFAQVQNGIFQPFSILYNLFPFYYSFKLLIVLQFITGGVFMYLTLRTMKLGSYAATTGALIFIFCGTFLSLINIFPVLQSVAWMPLIYLFLARALSDRSARWYGLLAAVLLVQLFSGQPEVILCDLLMMALVILMALPQLAGPDKRQFFRFAGITLLFLVALASIQYLPFTEYVLYSNRGHGLLNKEALNFSLHPWELASTLLPQFTNLWLQLNVLTEQNTGTGYLKNLNVGIIAALLLFCSLGQWRDRKYLTFLSLGLGSLLLMFGKFTPVYRFLLDYMPGFSLFRYPVKFMFLGTFCLGIMTAYGTEIFLQRETGGKKFKVAFVIVAVFFLSVFLYLVLWLKGQLLEVSFLAKMQQITGSKVLLPQFYKWTTYVFRSMQFTALCSVILAAGLLVLYWCYQRQLASQKTTKLILLVFLLVSLWLPSYNKETVINDEELRNFQMPIINYLKQDHDLFRVHLTKSISEKLNKINRTLLTDSLPLYKKLLIENIGQISHIYYQNAYETLKPSHSFNLNSLLSTQPSLSVTPILTLLNVKYVLSASALQDPYFVPVASAEEVTLYCNLKYLPRVSVVPQAVFLMDEKALYRKFIDNFDPAAEILLEGTVNATVSSGRGRVELLSYSPTEILIQAHIESEQAWVLLADAYFPGWYVYIDDIPANIYKADYVLRGVLVPGGKHLVRFQYSPLSFRMGLFASLAALFVLSLLCLRSWRGGRSDQWRK